MWRMGSGEGREGWIQNLYETLSHGGGPGDILQGPPASRLQRGWQSGGPAGERFDC